MNDKYQRLEIFGGVTVEQAASSLGVSKHQAIELIHGGSLKAERTAGGVFLIDAESLERLRIIRRGNGRPLKQETAWAALWLLSGLEVSWLEYHQRRRLDARLRQTTAQDLVWGMRKRASMIRMRISESFVSEASKCLALSGMSAVNKSDFDLVGEHSVLQGYVTDKKLNDFINSYHTIEAQNANVELHIVTDAPIGLAPGKTMPIAVVAADLATSLDARERKAGIKKLKELLDARRQN